MEVSTAVAVEVSVSADALLAFFFFEDFDSDLTAGFWVAGDAIVKKGVMGFVQVDGSRAGRLSCNRR